MEQYRVSSTSHHTADVLKDIVLSESVMTRRIFRASIVENAKEPDATVRGFIIHQKKKKADVWEDISEQKLTELKSGEGVKFLLHSGEVKTLFEELRKLYKLGENGIKYGEKDYVVAEANEIIKAPQKRKLVIQQLLAGNYGEDVWKELNEIDPGLATKFAYSRIQTNREKSLQEFKQNLNSNKDEPFWQKFFEDNTWIFGYGLNYKFLHLLAAQPHYGGTAVTGKGAQKGDYLLSTNAEASFTVLVEIKRPDTPLFSTKDYRNGVPLISGELAGATSQIQVNAYTWENEGSKTPANQEILQEESSFVIHPKGILVIGSTPQLLNDSEKIKAFELYRRNLANPEIITFDELLNRAEFILGNANPVIEQEESSEDDLPF